MPAAIQIKNATKTYGSHNALDNISLTVPTGEIFGFLGPNGAGKTTTIRCLMDYIHLSSGTATILGQDAHTSSAKLKNSIGYLSSDFQLHPDWTVRTHIDFLSQNKGIGQAEELVQKLNLEQHQKVQHLSSGNKQKLAIVLAFLGEPKLLIMDEPTRGLDPLLQNQLYELLKEFAGQGGTVFFSSHNLIEVQQLCTNVAIIRAGKIVAAEAMKDILHMQTHMIQAMSATPFDQRDFKLEHVEILSATDKSINFKVRGNIDQAMKALAKYTLIDLEVSHANLEDIFMEYY